MCKLFYIKFDNITKLSKKYFDDAFDDIIGTDNHNHKFGDSSVYCLRV